MRWRRVPRTARPPRDAIPENPARSPFVARRELVDAAWAHERLEPDHAPFCELVQPVEVARHQATPQTEVDDRRAPRGFELEIEGRAVDRHCAAVTGEQDD